MARMEAMMEALMQDRGLSFTPSGSIERDDNTFARVKSEAAFSMPILDPIHPGLQQLGQLSEQAQDAAMPVDPLLSSEMMPSVRVGDQDLPFPDPARYQQYVASFFGDVHLRHPCVDEVEFNARVQQLMTNGIAEKSDVHFLALCYLLFACCDVVVEKSPGNDRPPGSSWYQLAEGIIDKTSLSGADWILVQCFLFQVSVCSSIDRSKLTDLDRHYILPTPTYLHAPTALYAQHVQICYNEIFTSKRRGRKATPSASIGIHA